MLGMTGISHPTEVFSNCKNNRVNYYARIWGHRRKPLSYVFQNFKSSKYFNTSPLQLKEIRI